jgi:hypothetical protein
LPRLALPSAELRAVIVQHELHDALGHCSKPTATEGRVKQFATRSRGVNAAWKLRK